jgi:hypothetical protein
MKPSLFGRGGRLSPNRVFEVQLVPARVHCFAAACTSEQDQSDDVCAPAVFNVALRNVYPYCPREPAKRHHDALEFPDGETVLLTRLCEGQHATVLQLPASPRSVSAAGGQQRARTRRPAGHQPGQVGHPTQKPPLAPGSCAAGRPAPDTARMVALVAHDWLMKFVKSQRLRLANHTQSEWAARARRSLKFCEMQIQLQP